MANVTNDIEKDYRDAIADFPVLTREEEVELARRIKAGDEEAFQEFVNSNLKLVFSIAKKYRGSEVPFMDLVQVGNEKLIEAVRSFDESRGNKFSVYAYQQIEQEIMKMANKKEAFGISYEKSKELGNFRKALEEIRARYLREPSVEEIAKEIQKDVDYVKRHQEILKMTVAQSLDTPVGDSKDDISVGEMLAATESVQSKEKEQIVELVGDIEDEVVKKAVLLFFKIKVEDEKDTREVFSKIGAELNITAERARQIITSYFEYQKNRQGAECVEEYAQAFETMAVPAKSGIETTHTTDKFEQVRAWADVKYENDFVRNWDAFYRIKDTVELVKKIECTDFYVYFVRYLLERFSDILPNMSAEDIYADIRESKKDSPYLAQLVSCVKEEFERNGADGEKVANWIVSQKISENDFFTLAVGLDMELEDVEEFLKKVLLRDRLDLFKKEEMILYIALKYAQGDKQKFIKKATLVYDEAEPKQVYAVSKSFNTAIYKSKMEELLDVIEDEMLTFDDADEVMNRLQGVVSHMKYLVQQNDYQRIANRMFLKLYEDFKKLTESEVDRYIEPSQKEEKQAAYAEGEVELQYDCTEGLDIPEGHEFVRRTSEEEEIYEVLERVECEPSSEFQVLVPVMCTEETTLQPASKKHLEIGYAEKGTYFESGVHYIKEAKNKSMFKANKSSGVKGRIQGNLVLTCDAKECDVRNTCLPEGTIFTANGTSYATIQDTRIVPTVYVKVRGLKEAKIHEIKTIKNEEFYKQIFKIDNTKISFKKDSSIKQKEEKKDKLTHKLTGKLDKYLYLGAGGNNVYALNLEKADKSGKMREKLLRILAGTDIDFNNRPRTILNAKSNQRVVTREELLTMAFLTEMAREQFEPAKVRISDPEERLASRMQKVNFIMNTCGFYGIYPVNPYDCMMLYISTYEREPIYVFRNLWGNLQDYVARK